VRRNQSHADRTVRYTCAVTETYVLRRVTEDEFPGWARAIANSYAEDLTDEQVAAERATTELDRTLGAFDGSEPVGGTAAFTRQLAVPGAVLPVAGITWVGVAPTHRRRGILTAMMRRQLDDLHANGIEPIAALRPSEAGIYGRFGYGPAARGAQLRCDKRSMAFRPGTDFGTGAIRLLPADQARPQLEQVYNRVWPMTVGWPDRAERFWDTRLRDDQAARRGTTALRCAVHIERDGSASGYALYRLSDERDALGGDSSTVRVLEFAALSRQAHASLWRFLAGIDLVRWIDYEAAVDEPLPHLLTEPRALRWSEVDRFWVRLIDVGRALAGRRYATPLEVVLEIEDDFCPWNAGRLRLRADGDDVNCERTSDPADLQLSVAELGAAFLGGTTLASLAAVGLVRELRPGALTRATTAFRAEREPFYPGGPAFPAF
jgi:predicted acetyltransferase